MGRGQEAFITKHSLFSLYFSLEPVPHDWCNKGCGMYYHVCEMVHLK